MISRNVPTMSTAPWALVYAKQPLEVHPVLPIPAIFSIDNTTTKPDTNLDTKPNIQPAKTS